MTRDERLGKWAAHAAMIRLVKDMQDLLEENGLLTQDLKTESDNVLYTFLDTLPAKVKDDVREG